MPEEAPVTLLPVTGQCDFEGMPSKTRERGNLMRLHGYFILQTSDGSLRRRVVCPGLHFVRILKKKDGTPVLYGSLVNLCGAPRMMNDTNLSLSGVSRRLVWSMKPVLTAAPAFTMSISLLRSTQTDSVTRVDLSIPKKSIFCNNLPSTQTGVVSQKASSQLIRFSGDETWVTSQQGKRA